MPSAVVFAYHNVGVRCLLTLLAGGVQVGLVVTHRDNANETIWFSSVKDAAAEHGVEVVFAEDLDADALRGRVARISPDFIFSFYFRNMLPASVLALARHGAFNMHGSLLPKYRGRVPINWAIIRGERETGATLHEMTPKPDAGRLVAQVAVPILPDDTAHDVFVKVTVAAEQALWRALPHLIAGDATLHPNDLSKGSYFGGRTPEDGRIDWHRSARQIHDLVRAVAPPYPGATTTVAGTTMIIERTRMLAHAISPTAGLASGSLLVTDKACVAICGDDEPIEIRRASIGGKRFEGAALAAHIGRGAYVLGEPAT
jgi:methionyl-tRNA formyltransferase